MEKDIVDIDIEKLRVREKEISKVVNRYIRMRLKRNVKKLFSLNLK